MKFILKYSFVVLLAVLFATGCDKVNDLPEYESGNAPALATSVSAIAPAPADSLEPAVTFTWSYPAYASDSSSIKYVIEIDSAGRNFSNASKRVVTGALSSTYLSKEINEILLGFGFEFGKPYDMEVRITSSYSNNNDKKMSNVIAMKMTPYKIPPRVELPSSGKLFLVGDASDGGWSNPVPAPSQEFSRLDETTFEGVFHLTGSKQYLILPVNGSWDNKYSVEDNSIPGLSSGGDFGYNKPGNFPGPANDGMYKIVVNFQTGKFSVTPYSENNLPTNLYIVGNATAGDWGNPVPVPGQQFTRINSVEWEITLPLFGGKQYLFLPVNGDWSHKYSVDDNTLTGLAEGGKFGYDLSQNFPGPSADGTYKINVNFATSRFIVTKQ
ncbi:SusE domain-containing protein [Flavihumibacter solisilvae]|uniref:SusE outer membrane protein domain-containing protein n=1 Tax=Flavihumibacter solisilvae TaxID=1349421 RepID=A0A0C1L6S2_9BACT|nr:SusE domain-containing protein [Flavihumibacter solisilvae]KIC95216.1 hypothetical protein OI18_07925 [Flavihumibacter solisilvae]